MNENSTNKTLLFTIGHSDHTISEFISLAVRHGIGVIANVRSQPYSRFHPQFNRETLSDALKQSGIRYVYMGQELGARRSESESYREGRACYDLICGLPAFKQGLERLRRGMVEHRVALMCAEKDPITCHRSILVCRHLRSASSDIRYILEDGRAETLEQSEAKLLNAVGFPAIDLFQSQAQLVEQAYDVQGHRIEYVEPAAVIAFGRESA